MKVCFSKLPKDCYECPCFKNDLEFPCGLSDGTQDFFKDEIDGENCPLQSLKAHDRELVKEVCEKIRENIEARNINELDIINRLAVLLDEIEKEIEK